MKNKADYNVIKAATLDLVYGKISSAAKDVAITRKTSVQYFEGTTSRPNSGGQGYLKGKLLKTGRLNTDGMSSLEAQGKKQYIKEPVNGFFLIGADNSGKCFNIKESLTVGTTDARTTKTTDFVMENSEDLKYFDEPKVTFEDSIITGCHLDLDYNGLLDFCTNQKYSNLMIFQNLFNLKKIGKYGNSNPHFVEDWITVSQNNKINLNPTIDEGDGSCSFPSKG